jgi:putative SOS response-associated peptidase YedK
MCGRFTLTADGEALQLALGLDETPSVQPRYNIAPTQPVGVVTNDAPKKLDFYTWGLVPFWADDPSIGSRMINARSETVHEKPAFKAAFKYRRCLIPADGFYEWQSRGKGQPKVPMYVTLDEHQVFAFAGLWETWQSPDGSEIRSCVILTTDANERLKDIHDRMPVILQPDAYDTWLHADDPAERLALLKPFAPGAMHAYAVSTQVNKPANDSPKNIQPVEDDGAQQMSLF